MSTKLGSKAACLALAAVAAIAFMPAAMATPVTYDFTVNVTGGPFAGNVENGTFSYDSSSVAPDSVNVSSGLLTAFDFTFNGTTYDASTANTGFLGFDSDGNLTSFDISSSCTFLGCTFAPGTDNFSLFVPLGDGLTNTFTYSTTSIDYTANGDVTFALAGGGVPVPEPSTLGMFGFGVLLLGGVAARRRLAFGRSTSPAAI